MPLIDSVGLIDDVATGAASVTMQWVTDYAWDLTAETRTVSGTTDTSSETGLTNTVANATGASTFEFNGTDGLLITRAASGSNPQYFFDIGDHIDLGSGQAFDPMDRVFISAKLTYDLGTANDRTGLNINSGINGGGPRLDVVNNAGTVQVQVFRGEPSAGPENPTTINGGATTGTVWLGLEVAGATYKLGWSTTEPSSWSDLTNALGTANHISDSDATLTTTDLDDGYRGYIPCVGATGAQVACSDIRFRRYRAAEFTPSRPAEVQPTPYVISTVSSSWTASNTSGWTKSVTGGKLRLAWDGVGTTVDWSSTLTTAYTLINPTPVRSATLTSAMRSIIVGDIQVDEATANGIGIGIGFFQSASSPTVGVVAMLERDGSGTVTVTGPQGENTDQTIASAVTYRGGIKLLGLPADADDAGWDACQYDPSTGLVVDAEYGARGGAISGLGGGDAWYFGIVAIGANGTAGQVDISKVGVLASKLLSLGGV